MITQFPTDIADVDDSTLVALANLLNRHQSLFTEQGMPGPTVEFDAQWTSECIYGSKDQNRQVTWKPVRRSYRNTFTDMEEALEKKFHPSLVTYYCSHWSDGIWGEFANEQISLIQVWNDDDLDMLKKNLLGHAFAKHKNRLPLTLFIGCTSDDDIVSVDNESGQVIVEKPGKKAFRVLADNLATFLDGFTPSTRPYSGE
jgi:SecY interacting protein Syd